MKKIKPTAIEITSWQPYQKIIYKCSNCGQDFRLLGDRERFCHTCGVEVDWQNVTNRLQEPFDKNDYDSEKALIAEINKRQLN